MLLNTNTNGGNGNINMQTSKDSQEEYNDLHRERIYFYNLHKYINTNKINKIIIYAIWKMYFPTIDFYNFLHLKKILSFFTNMFTKT